MRRLYSSFARGWPGAGLLLLRLIAATALTQQAIVGLSDGTSIRVVLFATILFVVATLLVAGLWTPVAGVLVALIQVWNGYLGAGDLWLHIRLGTLGIALMLLGPGAWSVDARLFGWKRIDIRDPKN